MEKWLINIDRCKGCGLCVDFCKRDCIEMSDELNALGHHPPRITDPERCTSCCMCADMCPETAITIFRKKKTKKA